MKNGQDTMESQTATRHKTFQESRKCTVAPPGPS